MYNIIILSGVSGAGKSFLIQQALHKYEWLCQVPSITTREQRNGIDESDSRVFLSDYEFNNEVANGDLILVNTVFGKRYSYRNSDILSSIKQGKTVLLDMKINTVLQVKELFPKTLCIYIKVHSKRIESEIGSKRNNQGLRIKDAMIEQNSIENQEEVSNEVDILFENNIDDISVLRFMNLLAELR